MKTPEEFLRGHGFTAADELDRTRLIAALLSEMEAGLAGEKSSLLMIPAYLGVEGRLPRGKTAAVLDAGGTNFRGGLVTVPPAVSGRRNQPMPGTRGAVGEEDFYAAFAGELRRLMPEATVPVAGWCFSYPAEATADLDARLLRWTKGIDCPAIVGEYVGRELARRAGVAGVAVVNDTVATLLAAKACEGERLYSSYIGFILGTGTNTAYVEKNRNISKLPGLDPEGSMIINAEVGAFDKLAVSDFDTAMDAATGAPGTQRLEKMMAGAYLGPIALEIFRAAAKEGFFSARAVRALGELAALETVDLDSFGAGAAIEGRANPLDAIFSARDDARIARRLALPVYERAAARAAVQLAAFAIKSGEGASPDAPIAINADGSTYYRTRSIPFAATVKKELDELLSKRRNIHYEIVPEVADAPMVGAGIAAMLQHERSGGER